MIALADLFWDGALVEAHALFVERLDDLLCLVRDGMGVVSTDKSHNSKNMSAAPHAVCVDAPLFVETQIVIEMGALVLALHLKLRHNEVSAHHHALLLIDVRLELGALFVALYLKVHVKRHSVSLSALST